MDYSPAEAKLLSRQVTQSDIVDFFLKNMANEKLDPISNAHVVHADMSEYGAVDEKCIQLAELASKTGNNVSTPPALRPKLSDLVPEETCTLNDLPYDTDMEVPGAADFMSSAWQCKCSYEAQLDALLKQYGVPTEAELAEENAYSALRKEFWAIFESVKALGQAEAIVLDDDERNRVYEMKASAWYRVTYHPKWVQQSREILLELHREEEDAPARLSFMWIPVEHLTRIKLRCRGGVKAVRRRPVERLAAYSYMSGSL
ncbi:hypothetical protein VPH35_066190 [Triticum aestivum]